MDTLIEGSRSRDVSPLDDRFRLVSLGEIVRAFDAKVLMNLGHVQGAAPLLEGVGSLFGDQDKPASERQKELVLSSTALAAYSVAFFDLPVSYRKLQDIVKELDGNPTGVEILASLKSLIQIVDYEMDTKLLFHVENPHAGYYEKPLEGWDSVLEKFGSIAFDVEEAGKCIALNRYTASVFHLMRVMEHGLHALGVSLNDPGLQATTNRSWDAILKKCRAELEKPVSKRSAEWSKDDQFFAAASERLLAVKDAWRNPTMHIEMVYTDEMAEDVYESVKRFMRQLAGKLSE